ncbi:MAG TPA: hypothetical protein VK157_17230 [Phycisphaerales bacterium]|nr:hypothetical protein [Phycisphaerales bacterium]
MLAIPLFILFGVLIAIAAVRSSKRREERRVARQEFVASSGMREVPSRAERRERWNELVTTDYFETGADGVRWMAIDDEQSGQTVAITLVEHAWTHSEPDGGDDTYVHTLACTTSVRGLPLMHVRDRSMRALGAKGDPDIFASGDAALDQRCVVRAIDQAKARAILTPTVRAWLTNMPHKSGCLLSDRGITLYTRGHCSPRELDDLAQRVRELVRVIASAGATG